MAEETTGSAALATAIRRLVELGLKAMSKLTGLRLASAAVVLAATLAGCFTYFVPQPRAEADQLLSPSLTPTKIDQHPNLQEQATAAFERAAAAIISLRIEHLLPGS